MKLNQSKYKNLDLVQNQSNQEKESIILELHKQIQEFQEQLQNQRDQYQHDVQQHQIQIKLNQERFDLVLQQEINQINCQMEQQISTKEEEKQGFLDQIKALENKIVQLDQKNKEIYLQSQSNQNLYRQLIEQLETLQQESQNEQLKWKDLLQQKDEKIRTIEINSKSEIGKLNEQLIHTSERRAQIEQDQIKLIEQEQITNQELQKLKEQLEQKQNEIDSIDKLLNERVLDNEELNGKLILVSKEMSLYKDQNKDLQSQISQQSESNSNTINELKFKIKEQDFLINQLQSQVKDFECQMNLQLSEVILQSKDLVNKKQQELDISSNELTQLKNQFIKLQNENDDLLKQITILQEINNNKDIQINDFENQVTKLHEQVNTINNYNQLKQEELDNVLNLLKIVNNRLLIRMNLQITCKYYK